ncbi:uncharacterized protein LOC586013 isoform X1 [Strongylocentrotus purpuratus]|uniref:Zinc finger PHD-type domain-containing protein n=1 Tax=Strongylocentrotus purpuratus TaxID=7668 RepID=A0A7M7GHI0_STRPU|nr:uncharacterized protein LOC586013 isoform X1 [Strongylocentrotus purpuratus]
MWPRAIYKYKYNFQRRPLKKPRFSRSTGSSDIQTQTPRYTRCQCQEIESHSNHLGQVQLQVRKLAAKYVRSSKYGRAFKLLKNKSAAFTRAVQKIVQDATRAEIRNICKPSTRSVWRSSTEGKKLQSFQSFSWKEALSEARQQCPFLHAAIIGAATANGKSDRRSRGSSGIARHVRPAVGAIFGMLAFMGNPKTMRLLQELVGIQLWLSNCGRETFQRLNGLGMCTFMDRTATCIDTMIKESDRDILEKKKELEACEAPITAQEPELATFSDPSNAAETNQVESSISSNKADGPENPEETTSMGRTDESPDNLDETMDDSPPDGTEPAKIGYTLVFDNASQMMHDRYNRGNKGNKELKMVKAYAAFDRVPSYLLSDTPPTANDILRIDPQVYLPNDSDETLLRQEYTVIVSRILTRLMPCFQRFAEHVKNHIPHPYFKESKQKSKIVPLGVLMKDDAKTYDMVDILQSYHGLVPYQDGEPVTTVLYGDGLRCERARDALNSRRNATNSFDRLEGLHPSIQERHKRGLLLEDTYKLLYDVRSSGDVGTLSFIKNKFGHRKFNPDKVIHAFNSATDLLQLSTEAYVVAAACLHVEIDDPSKMPKDLPEGDEGLLYFQDVVELVVEIAFQYLDKPEITVQHMEEPESEIHAYPYCICHTDIEDDMLFCENPSCRRGSWFHLSCMNMSLEDVPEDKYYCSIECSQASQKKKRVFVFHATDDHVFQYSRAMLFRGLGERARYDAIRENDGDRIISHWRFDMVDFYNMQHPKYFIEGFHLLTDMNGGVPERVAHQLKWNRTVNVRGGRGHNISMDLAMDHLKEEFKVAVKSCSGNITPSTMKHYSRVVGIHKDFKCNFDVHLPKTNHGSRNTQEGTLELAKLLLEHNCLEQLPGRSHAGFSDFVFKHALTQPDIFIECIENHKLQRVHGMDVAHANVSVEEEESQETLYEAFLLPSSPL